MIKIVCCGLLLLCAASGVALGQANQSPVATDSAAVVPVRRTYYLGKKGELLTTPDNADHREERVYRDSVGGTLRIYYPSGKLRRTVSYADFDRDIRSGADVGFYETGKVKSQRGYHLDKPVGEELTYYPTGAVRSRLSRDEPGAIKTTYYSPDGQTRPESSVSSKNPRLIGGAQDIAGAVMKNLRYPAEARQQGIKGRMYLQFTVDEAGFIRHIRIVKSLSPVLDAAATKAIAALGRLIPGEQDGETVDTMFTLPIAF